MTASFAFHLIWRPRKLQNGRATTITSVNIVRPAVDTKNRPLSMQVPLAVGSLICPQKYEIGMHWKMTTWKMASIRARLKMFSAWMQYLTERRFTLNLSKAYQRIICNT
ncbi:hypothetical protein PG991_003059 [Apiospora marii]|uniref:Uncharacterized protein n=1 Tax=Apiospora marii TaxID=335849 RepID=A0ABR1SH78_9PEZI